MNSQLAYHANVARIEELVRTAAARNPSLPVDDRVPFGARLRTLVAHRFRLRLRPRTAC
jgi:hypothetical protein